MPHKAKVSGSEKIASIEKYLRGEDSLNHLAALRGVAYQSILQWLQTYQSLGPAGLQSTSKNSNYPSALKAIAVQDYLAGGGSHKNECQAPNFRTSLSKIFNKVLLFGTWHYSVQMA